MNKSQRKYKNEIATEINCVNQFFSRVILKSKNDYEKTEENAVFVFNVL